MVTQRQTPYSNILGRVADVFRSIYRFAGRLVLGGLALIAAGIVALAMTFVGVLIAIAAVISRLTRGTGGSARARANRAATPETDDVVILEARKTGHGWTVE